MLSSPGVQTFSDVVFRQFLLGQLAANQQSQFEAALLSHSQLEQRVRLAEIELLDDYARDRLSAKERNAFQTKFLITEARRRKLAVAMALQESLGHRAVPERSSPLLVFTWPRLSWRIAFVVLALVILFAGALVIRREPQIVRSIIPRRLRRPAAVRPPTPQPAHHPANSSESREHRDESPASADHEAMPHIFVLRPNVAGDEAPVITLADHASQAIRLELRLEKAESETFAIVVTTSDGEVVHHIPEFRVQSANYLDFDVQRERLRPGDFQVKLTRIDDPSVATIYYFRVE